MENKILNYLQKKTEIIRHLKKKKIKVLLFQTIKILQIVFRRL